MYRLFGSQLAFHASQALGRLAETSLPKPVLTPLVKAYAWGMGVRLDEAKEPEGGYRSFADFFGRELAPGARRVCGDPQCLVSPCDGRIVEVGRLEQVTPPTYEIKGNGYSLESLLGRTGEAEKFTGGGYAVIYLHPRDYHRVHVPLDGELTGSRHIPGRRYPVNSWSDNRVEDLYGKNERVVFDFEVSGKGRLALVMVAAFGVGNIESRYNTFDSAQRIDAVVERKMDPPVALQRGDMLGAFRLGSTVVLVWDENCVELDSQLGSENVAMGQRLGSLVSDAGK